MGAAWQIWVVVEVGFFCVNFDLIFFFFFCGFMVVELGVVVMVVEGVEFLLWVICGFMVVKVGGCRGDGGSVAMSFDG